MWSGTAGVVPSPGVEGLSRLGAPKLFLEIVHDPPLIHSLQIGASEIVSHGDQMDVVVVETGNQGTPLKIDLPSRG